MTPAQTTAWNVYVERINTVLNQQLADMQAGRELRQTIFAPPTPAQIAIIERALDNAALESRQKAISDALGPVVRAIDAIDNSGKHVKKTAEGRELYACLSGVYDALHALKKAAATAEPAK